MKQLNAGQLLLPLTVLGFIGVAVTFLNPVFTTQNRWALLLLLLLYLLLKGSFWRSIRNGFGCFTALFSVWSLLTAFWSEIPLLSLMKAIAFGLVTLVCLGAGYVWVRQRDTGRALDYLIPLMVTALLAGLLGQFSATAVDYSGSVILYQGLVTGSNMFGSMLAMCSPLLVWKCWDTWKSPGQRLLWLLLSAIALYYLLAASSRAAILITLITLAGLFLALSPGRRTQLAILGVCLLAVFAMVAPGRFEEMRQQYIYKQATREQGIFFTRENVWEVSYEQAIKGGWFGGGYGVTIGGAKSFKGGLTAMGYGREKGNSQLAILEETGIIGGVLHVLSLVALFARLRQAMRRRPPKRERVMLAVVTAGIVGMLAGSVFEAWMVAPGAPESVSFWTLIGVALGLSDPRYQGRQAVAATPVAQPGIGVQVRHTNSMTN